MPDRNKNIKLLFKYFLAPVLAAWLFYALYRQIRDQSGLSDAWHLIKTAPSGPHAWEFWLAVLLIAANWGLEAIKWKLLLTPLEKVTFSKAFKSVLSGITLSINTPNRIGEYGGRMIYVSKGKRLKSIPLSIAGSLSQLTVTMVMGNIALVYLRYFRADKEENLMGIPDYWVNSLLFISFIVTILLILFFFRIPLLVRFLKRFRRLKAVIPFITALEKLRLKLLLSLLILSSFRYIIFILQYMLLWQVFGVVISFPLNVSLVALFFLILSAVPSFAIADLGIRGQFGIVLFGTYSSNSLGIIASTFGIWILNLFLPALTGSIVILSSKLFKEKQR